VAHIAVAGYSFGAAVGLHAAMSDERVEILAGVSLPIGMMDGSFLLDCVKPKLLVAGDRDEFCPLSSLEDLFSRLPDPKRMQVVPGADHFWFGHDSDAARVAADYLDEEWKHID
jgi:alpha/beta superfamily hydrolase